MKIAAYALLIPIIVMQNLWHESNWHVLLIGTLCYMSGALMEKGIQKALKQGPK